MPDERVSAILKTADVSTPPGDPRFMSWGSRELGLRDPNGYFLTFTEDAGSFLGGQENEPERDGSA
ncbi:MAG TPA: hypothetical protein VF195_12270 [Actinomycetota bacterium]